MKVDMLKIANLLEEADNNIMQKDSEIQSLKERIATLENGNAYSESNDEGLNLDKESAFKDSHEMLGDSFEVPNGYNQSASERLDSFLS